MARPDPRRHLFRLTLAMVVYVGFMLLAWPAVRGVGEPWLKVLLALAPVVPMLYVIGLMVRRIRDSDELEQRTHLVALGVAAAVVSGLSLAGGFLAAAHVLRTDASILIWVFPVMVGSYGLTRWCVARRYGMGASCGESRGSRAWSLLLVGLLAAALAWFGRDNLGDMQLGILCGLAGGGLLGAAALAVARGLERRAAPDRED